MDDTGQEIAPAPAEAAPTGQRTDMAEIAQRISSESMAAVPRPASLGPAPSAPGLVDRWGRAFDAALHLTKKDGTPATRGGTLITLKGKQGNGPQVRQATARPDSVAEQIRLVREAAGEAEGQPSGEGDELAGGQGAEEAAEEAAPQLSPEEFQRRAAAGARFVRKIMGKFGRWMAGEEGEFQTIDGAHEGKDIEDSTLDVQMEYGKLVPAGSVALLLFNVSTYVGRCWGTEKNQERVEVLVARFTGRPAPVKPQVRHDQVVQVQQQQPAPTNKPAPAPVERGRITSSL